MKQEVTKYQFHDAFKRMGREAYFLEECDDRDVLFIESGEEVTNYDN